MISAVSSGFKVTSSGTTDNSAGTCRSGLDLQTGPYGAGSWCAGLSDQNQWIMMKSVRPVMWKKVATMGDKIYDQRITSYYIM